MSTSIKKLEAVLFDLDGTLIDTAPDFAKVVNQLCQQHGRPTIDYQTIRNTVSHGARALVSLAFDYQEGDAEFESMRQELLQLYGQHLAVDTCLFEGMENLLSWLENNSLPWGIVTNKPRLYATPILDALGLSPRCEALVCPDDVRQTKPNAEPMLLACSQLSCNATNTVYVGDHRRDIEAGRNAGMKTVAANYGYIDPEDPAINWLANYTVEHPRDIQPLLTDNFNI
jgi:2-phosphoglycolate phosphatase